MDPDLDLIPNNTEEMSSASSPNKLFSSSSFSPFCKAAVLKRTLKTRAYCPDAYLIPSMAIASGVFFRGGPKKPPRSREDILEDCDKECSPLSEGTTVSRKGSKWMTYHGYNPDIMHGTRGEFFPVGCNPIPFAASGIEEKKITIGLEEMTITRDSEEMNITMDLEDMKISSPIPLASPSNENAKTFAHKSHNSSTVNRNKKVTLRNPAQKRKGGKLQTPSPKKAQKTPSLKKTQQTPSLKKAIHKKPFLPASSNLKEFGAASSPLPRNPMKKTI